MSGWKLVTRELYAAGRPMQRTEFAQDASGADPYKGLRDARRMGLVRSIRRSKFQWVWEITDAGRAWVEGRAELAPQRRDGKPRPLVATWLMQLPATNEIRITA
jgi:hypothetical protein